MINWFSRTICLLALGALALSTASAAPAAVRNQTPEAIRAAYNEQMKDQGDKRLQRATFSSQTSKGSSWTLSNGKSSRASTGTATFTMGGKLDADGLATSMIFTASPSRSKNAGSSTYRGDWTAASIYALQAFLDSCGAPSAKDIKAYIGTDLGMPIDFTFLSDGLAATRVELKDQSASKTVTVGDRSVKLQASIKKNGKFELRAEFVGETKPTGDAVALVENGVTKVKVGQKYTVKLTANAGTGYAWTYAFTEGSDLSTFLGKNAVEAENRPGGPTTFEWTFSARTPGRQTVAFSLARSWEDDAPEKNVLFTIDIVR